jgi:D-serine deaminase-like pyridoxal phosphate-dependent protein
MRIDDLDTPAVLVDIDLVKANVGRWQEYCDQHGIANRPHIKTHKLSQLARMQVEAGAVGVTCQKLGEVEAMLDGGIQDILLPYNILGAHKLERLNALRQRGVITVAADSATTIEGLGAAMRDAGNPLPVMVECDTGLHRCGVQTPEEALALAQLIDRLPGLRFAGLMTYPTSLSETPAFFERTRELCAQSGLDVARTTGGGTPVMWRAHEAQGIDEHRVGTYIYNDRMTVRAGVASWDDCALTILATVVSKPTERWCVLDGGSKTFAMDTYGLEGHGYLPAYPEARLTKLSEEHGVLETEGSERAPTIGERVRVIPNHVCVISNLHNQVYIVRGDEVVDVWQVQSRGAVQ